MGAIVRRDYSAGWVPAADAMHAPPNGALRFDNLIDDELGTASLRLGSSKINSVAFPDSDIHSLFTTNLSGTRYRYAGANNNVYRNGVSLGLSMAGSGDIAFGTWLDQVFIARSSSKRKDDGSTLRNWGISMSGSVPTVAGVAADSKTLATCNSGESPAFAVQNSIGAAPTFATGRAGGANASMVMTPNTANTSSPAAYYAKDFGSEQDFDTYDGGQEGTDEDRFEMWIYITDIEEFLSLDVTIDVNASTTNLFEEIYVIRLIRSGSAPEDELKSGVIQRNLVSGWNRVLVRRGDFKRLGTLTPGKNWSTVNAIGFYLQSKTTAGTIRVDDVRLLGGVERPLFGFFKYRYQYAYNNGTYTALSPPSAESDEIELGNQSASVTVPADGSRDSQTNEIWLFRQSRTVGTWYRVAVQTGVSGTGAVVITDDTSNEDAILTNIVLKTDATVPPNDIVDMAGPYFDRWYVLADDGLYISEQHNPDTFNTDWILSIGDISEVPHWIAKAPGALYIGTSRDVYEVTGDGTELPTGLLNFNLRPLHVDFAPISAAHAVRGAAIVYLASTGWRVLTGAGSSNTLTENTDLLYRGYTRHGISPVNIASSSARFRAAIAKDILSAITPEGASTTSSRVLHRYDLKDDHQHWWRHTYPNTFRAIHAEPDGTLIASDSSGFVWVIDDAGAGGQDDGSNIAVVFWTRADDDGAPFRRKDPQAYRARFESGGNTVSIGLHLDGSGSAATTLTGSHSGVGLTESGIDAVSAFRQVQQRITVTTNSFRWLESAIEHLDLPPLMRGELPEVALGSLGRKVFGGVAIRACTLAASRTFTPYIDDTAQSTFSFTTGDDEPDTYRNLFTAPKFGTDFNLFVDGDIEFYEWEPIVIAKLPMPFLGRTLEKNAGSSGIKVFNGVQMRVCTRGASVTVTIHINGTAQTATHTIKTGTDEPDEITLPFAAAVEGTEIAIAFSAEVELYEWRPVSSVGEALGLLTWDSGPILFPAGPHDRIWVYEYRLLVRAGGDLTFSPYFDGYPRPPITKTIGGDANQRVRVDVPVGRGYSGRTPRVVISSSSVFYPYWLQVIYRATGGQGDLEAHTIQIAPRETAAGVSA